MEREIIKNSIDLVYADPPYNLSGKIILHVKMEKLQSVIKVHGIR
jgi:DNA methylase.